MVMMERGVMMWNKTWSCQIVEREAPLETRSHEEIVRICWYQITKKEQTNKNKHTRTNKTYHGIVDVRKKYIAGVGDQLAGHAATAAAAAACHSQAIVQQM